MKRRAAKATRTKQGASSRASKPAAGPNASKPAASSNASKSAAGSRPAKQRAARASAAGKQLKGTAAKPSKAAKPAPRRPPARSDLGAPIDGFFSKHPPELREILESLRALIDDVVPDATASLKWGMPFYELNGKMLCALGGHKAHVNLILSGPPGAFDDPDGLLSGESKLGRHLKLTRLEELPERLVRGWLKSARELALGEA